MKKREPGFLGLAKQNAKRKGMVKVPRRHNIQGEAHYPVFVTAKEMKELKLDGGSGEMTKYDIPAFPAYNPGGTEKSSSDEKSRPSSAISGTQERGDTSSSLSQNTITTPAPMPEVGFKWDDSKDLWGNI